VGVLTEPRNANLRQAEEVDVRLLKALPGVYTADLENVWQLTGDAIDPGLWPTFRARTGL
jgi:hypothetical protein